MKDSVVRKEYDVITITWMINAAYLDPFYTKPYLELSINWALPNMQKMIWILFQVLLQNLYCI